jgi:hypothetical protein
MDKSAAEWRCSTQVDAGRQLAPVLWMWIRSRIQTRSDPKLLTRSGKNHSGSSMEIDQAIRIWMRQYGYRSGNKKMDQAGNTNMDQAVWS